MAFVLVDKIVQKMREREKKRVSDEVAHAMATLAVNTEKFQWSLDCDDVSSRIFSLCVYVLLLFLCVFFSLVVEYVCVYFVEFIIFYRQF